MKQRFKRDDARRMAQTLLAVRREQGEALPAISTRSMGTVASNLLVGFAARPATLRTARLTRATPKTIILRIGAY